jgi:hypothetical protein
MTLLVTQAAPGAAYGAQVRAVLGATGGWHQDSWQKTISPEMVLQSSPTLGEATQVLPAPQ